MREELVNVGEITLVPKGAPVEPHVIHDYIWTGALKSAKRVEREFGLNNEWPWDDFEWGMINGKLSALRWVLGEDWDELYT